MTRRMSQFIVTIGAALSLLIPQPALAQDRSQLSLSVTPPLIQLSLAPGQTWSSTLKVVNTNEYELPLYASMAVLETNGDEGQSKFTPVLEGSETSTLANWVKLGTNDFKITEEKSFDLPFTITVPEDASPGGHYAAIIIGSQPLGEAPEGASISVSSSISTLLFLRVAGDVVEKGTIREFTTEDNFYSRPNVKFLLRFENSGNVHIQPQGEIVITNMWGKERGKIPINQKTRFGNVLPESIRKFEFEWKGEWNPLEFGRYKAQAVLSYGTDQKESVNSTDYFWIIPLKETVALLGGFIIFVIAALWAIRRYIRRSLLIETQRLAPISSPTKRKTKTNPKSKTKLMKAELPSMADAQPSFISRMIAKLRGAPILVVSIAIIVIGLIGLIIFFTQVLKSERNYEVEVIKPDNKNVKLNNGQDESVQSSNPSQQPAVASQTIIPPVEVLNATGKSGLANTVATFLRGKGVAVSGVGNAARSEETTIEYHPDDKAAAESLNRLINNQAQLKATGIVAGKTRLIIGSNYQ